MVPLWRAEERCVRWWCTLARSLTPFVVSVSGLSRLFVSRPAPAPPLHALALVDVGGSPGPAEPPLLSLIRSFAPPLACDLGTVL